jgi:hypothetical protein
MSFYATIAGHATFPDDDSFNTAIKKLEEGKWLVREGDNIFFVDEMQEKISKEPNFDLTARQMEIPLSHYRNLSRMLDVILPRTTGTVVWTSTDGCFQGGVFNDGVETITNDLEKWWDEGGDYTVYGKEPKIVSGLEEARKLANKIFQETGVVVAVELISDKPNVDENFEGYCEWQSEVEQGFFEEYL